MAATFPGTMSAEAMALLPMISGRHLQGPDLPVHPYEANPRTLEWNQTLLATRLQHPFLCGGGHPHPSAVIDFFTFHFVISHTCNTFELCDVVGYCLIVHTSDTFSCCCCCYNLYSLLAIHTYRPDVLRHG